VTVRDNFPRMHEANQQLFVELTSGEATGYDFADRADGLPAIYPDWLELPNGGTLTFHDMRSVEQTISSAPAGYRLGVAVRKIVTCTDTIRLGTATAAGIPGATGAKGAAGADWTVTAVKTTDYTAVAGEFVRVSTAAAHTITLPTAVGCDGKRIAVKDVTGAGAGTNNITIATTSSQTIDATTPVAIATNRKCVVYISDGANWLIESAS
jgi:hypothetical protein